MTLREKAIKTIEAAFDGKADKGGAPYTNHLLMVASKFESDDVLYISALLHDIVEDCENWSVDIIEREFGYDVARIVDSLTRRHGEGYTDYIFRVCGNERAMRIKLADLQDNMDLTRIKTNLSKSDLFRVQKYHNAYLLLRRQVLVNNLMHQ